MRASYELDAAIGNAYLFFLIQSAGSHLERFFAHAEKGVNSFGVGPVVIGEPAFILLEEAEDLFGSVFGAFIAGFAGDYVELSFAGGRSFGGQDIFDKAGEAVTGLDVAKGLVEVEHAGVAVVDNNEPADIGSAEHGEIHGIFFLNGKVFVTK